MDGDASQRVTCLAPPRNLLRAASLLITLALTLAPDLSSAIDGGALAGRTTLSRATVAIGTIAEGDESVGISRCSGVLIAPDLVLTAAHCVRGESLASGVVLYDGAKPRAPVIRVVAVTRYAAVPDDLPAAYASLLDLSLDTAVLRLASPVRGREPIAIGNGRVPPRGLRLAGAGLSRQGVGVLKTAELETLAVTSTGLIVAATRGSAVCKGDSGGPVVADGPRGPILWGVASAILTTQGPCGHVVVIAPAAPNP